MKSAFSLVELSIVLVILGLLTGGILSGQSLIRAAELRSVATEYSNYITATQTFRDKYMGIPGDFNKATDFWGAEPLVNCPSTATVAATGTATCNGEGDGRISLGVTNEPFRFWQHLANAGLVEGRFSGVTGGAANNYTATASNVPASKLSSAYWWVWNWRPYNGVGFSTLHAAIPVYDNILMLGALQTNSYSQRPILNATEVWNIDTKVDDGKPGYGKMIPFPYVGNCTTAATVADLAADYALSNTSMSCAIIFNNAF
jgi:prepilin-type N-terminal cleavage/methylation domain-containing protein